MLGIFIGLQHSFKAFETLFMLFEIEGAFALALVSIAMPIVAMMEKAVIAPLLAKLCSCIVSCHKKLRTNRTAPIQPHGNHGRVDLGLADGSTPQASREPTQTCVPYDF